MGILNTVVEWLGGGGGDSRRKFEAIETEVAALSVDEARAQMTPLLADPERYRTVRAPDRPAPLPPAAAGLLGEYAEVAEKYGDTVISREDVRPSECYPEYFRIGESTDGSEVIVGRTGDTVYIVGGTEDEPGEMEKYPSIYHYLLCNARIIYPEAFEGGRPDA